MVKPSSSTNTALAPTHQTMQHGEPKNAFFDQKSEDQRSTIGRDNLVNLEVYRKTPSARRAIVSDRVKESETNASRSHHVRNKYTGPQRAFVIPVIAYHEFIEGSLIKECCSIVIDGQPKCTMLQGPDRSERQL
jgi:hypothetical protein